MSEFDFEDAVAATQAGTASLRSVTEALLTQLTLQERLHLLDGDEPFWPGLHGMLNEGYNRRPIVLGSVPRLKLPGIRFADGPRGCVLGASTAFPVAMARGASWDVGLEERVGLAVGRECRAQGANYFAGVCVNLPRHPAWGRIQETYGEDPVLLGEFGAALVRGVQRNVMACAKHFALNSMENARFQVDVQVDEDVLHEVFLPHFRRIVDQGVASVMSAYNSVRGEWCGQNRELLQDILRDQWKFGGFVLSDFLFGLRDAPLSLKNGLDVEAPFAHMRSRTLPEALERGVIQQADVDRACVAVLAKQIEHAARKEDHEPQLSEVFCEEHRRLARVAAASSMVLLKNKDVQGKPVLPLPKDISNLAVIGRLANSTDTGDRGSSAVRSPEVISPYRGIKDALPKSNVVLENSGGISKAKDAASVADAAVVVVGYDWRDEGEFTIPPFKTNPGLKNTLPPQDDTAEAKTTEKLLLDEIPSEELGGGEDNYGFGAGGDRTSLRLHPHDVEIIKAASEVNTRVVVVIVAAGAVIMSEWDDVPPAILYGWYSGCEGGHALADILLGDENPSGRLPFSIPSTENHLPFFDKDVTNIVYDRWFGQHLLDRLGTQAAYPFGFGLSYTTFSIFDVNAKKHGNGEELEVEFQVRNTGSRRGRFVAQVYGTIDVPKRPRRVLLGFSSMDILPGVGVNMVVPVSTRPLHRWEKGTWILLSNTVGIEVSAFAGSRNTASTVIDLA
ncbi:hypothetical protein N3K66_008664 [Trichothecium roseum]|uniref:Uncharacterized protein n=1 Tax=Trichothecium roseum TaxID=47278 RepID=A0ACC0UTD0_9HYPO|nr:hypothetical protein N3K66_008664 [Trichothecium roseum]